MQDRRISYSEANLQADVFLKTLSVVMDLPGDWHTGLNMVQSIYNIFYTGFLDEFQQLLSWQRINKDVKGCYFNATRLVTFVFDELTRFFAHKYVSERRATPAEVEMSDVDFVASVGLGFREYVRQLKHSPDHWVATCGCFMEMAHDFCHL